MARTPKFIDAYHFGPPIQARGLGSLNDLALHHVDLQERLDLRSDLLLHRGLRAGLLEDDQDVDDLGPDSPERLRNRQQGAAGRDHIVDEDDPIAAMDEVVVVPEAHDHGVLEARPQVFEGHQALRTRSRAASPARSRMSVSPFTWPSRIRTTPSQIVVSTTPPCAE